MNPFDSKTMLPNSELTITCDDSAAGGCVVRKLAELPRCSYQTRQLNVLNDGKTIVGEALIPDNGAAKHPLMIFSHGLAVNHDHLAGYYQEVAALGIAVYTFDFRGGSSTSASEGNSTEMSAMTEVTDLEAVLKQAKTWDWVDQNKIALFGHSQGGFVTALTAARHPDDICSILLISPGFNIPDTVRESFAQYMAEGRNDFQWGGMSLGMIFVDDMINYDPYSEVRNFKGKVLLVHGDADRIVKIDYSRKLKEIYPEVMYREISGGKHIFKGDSLTAALECVVEFVQKTGFLKVSSSADIIARP